MQKNVAHATGLSFALRTALLVAGLHAVTSVPLFAQSYTFTQIDGPNSTFTEGRGINDNGEIVGEFTATSSKGVTTTTGFLYNSRGRLTTFIPRGVTNLQAIAVNSSDQIVGMYRDASNVSHGYRYAKGKFTSLDPTGSTLTFVWGINNAGQAVGTFQDTGIPSTHGFLYTPPSFATLNGPGVTTGFTGAFGVNSLGDVAGLYATTSTGALHGFTKIGGTFATIDPPGSIETHALGINASDEVVGFYYDSSNHAHGFLYQPGIGFTVLNPPGGAGTYAVAQGINDAGQVVGQFTDSVGVGNYHVFVYSVSGATYATLDPPGATGEFTLGNGINSVGQVVGEFSDSAGATHAFLATPQ